MLLGSCAFSIWLINLYIFFVFWPYTLGFPILDLYATSYLLHLTYSKLNHATPSLYIVYHFEQEAKRRPLATRLTGKAILAAAATDSAGCHHDSVLSLASVKLNQRLLISSSRDGAIKVWKWWTSLTLLIFCTYNLLYIYTVKKCTEYYACYL